MNYYRRYVGDYLKKTIRLTMAAHGAYGLMLDYYYAEEQPLPLDMEDVYTIAHAATDDDRRVVDKVLAGYFTREHDGYHNERADEEIAAAVQARTNGERGGRPKTGTQTGRITDKQTGEITEVETKVVTGTATKKGGGMVHPPTTNHHPPTTTPQPSASNPQPRSRASRAPRSPAPGFPDFWVRYPRKTAKSKAEKAWAALDPDADLQVTMLAALEDHKQSRQWSDKNFIPHPATWLNQRRWEDEVSRGTDGIEDANQRAAAEWLGQNAGAQNNSQSKHDDYCTSMRSAATRQELDAIFMDACRSEKWPQAMLDSFDLAHRETAKRFPALDYQAPIPNGEDGDLAGADNMGAGRWA